MTDPAYDAPAQPLRDGDSSIDPEDAAQAEWDATSAVDAGADPDDLRSTATGADPAELATDTDDIPREDQHFGDRDVETQGSDPVDAALGEDGQGDLSPEDL